MRQLRDLADLTANPNAAGLTSGFDMGPGVAQPLWPGRAENYLKKAAFINVFHTPP